MLLGLMILGLSLWLMILGLSLWLMIPGLSIWILGRIVELHAAIAAVP